MALPAASAYRYEIEESAGGANSMNTVCRAVSGTGTAIVLADVLKQ
jgi:hypothetical protein